LIEHNVNGVLYYTFEIFDELPFVSHAFSTRIGGVSEGVFSSMNLSFSRGDKPEAVRENFERICGALGTSAERVVLSAQTHGIEIYCADEADCGRGVTRDAGYAGIDGLVTGRKNVVLCTQYADCVPLFFADPVKKVVATAHAGWRGTAARIGAAAVERMCREYGCDSADIRGGIGPSIGPCCFEVDAPVAEVFATMNEGNGCVRDDGGGKFHVDLWEINRRILLGAGLREKNVTVSGLCTRCAPNTFWSHRVAGSSRGSLAALIFMP